MASAPTCRAGPPIRRGGICLRRDRRSRRGRARSRGRGSASESRRSAPGVTPNTPEYIFTPAGMPSTGVASPVTAQMSRAVPSPPQNRTRSTPAATKFLDRGSRVPRRRARSAPRARSRSHVKPAVRNASYPMAPAAVSHSIVGGFGAPSSRRLNSPKRLQRPRIGGGLGAEAHRLRGNAIGAFESDAAAHSGDRIDEEAYARHRRNAKWAGGIP